MAGITYEIDDKSILEQIGSDAKRIAEELVEAAHLGKGQIVVVGCSTSETLGQKIGNHSVPQAGKAIFEALQGVFAPHGIYIAAQCCEHLNRAIIIERAAVPNAEIVNVVPQPKAGGSLATAAWKRFKDPVAVLAVQADAGLDIGQTVVVDDL